MAKYKFKSVKQHASNYNYKTKRSFGQKIKNFFTIPEEDLKEEESPKFERVKLFALNRARLFAFLALFFLIVNILIIFDLNIIYLRQILGFLFIVLVPGLLIMLCLKISKVGFWEYLVYTVGLSIAFIMFAGLLVNWTLPALNITDKPLSLWPILICFDIFLLGLWLTAIYRNRDLKPFDITIPKLDAINRVFFIIPMLFPLLSILGAFLLNNHGPNILTMIMLGGIAVYVLLLVIFRKHMNENVWPWALWMMGLALLLSGWMRSWSLVGDDNSAEFFIFRLTSSLQYWSINSFFSSYNAMLSINILPLIINIFSSDNINYWIYKFTLQILISFIGVILFIYFSKIFNIKISFFSSFLFLSLPMLYSGISLGVRQEFAFLFLGMMILVLLTRDIKTNIKKLLFVIFGASMIVSHYSTAYIALAIFTLTYIFTLMYKIYENKKIKKGKISKYEKSEFYLTGILVLLLLIFGFFWYNQVTSTEDGIISFASKSISNLGNMFNDEVQEGNNGILGNFLTIKGNSQSQQEILKEYINKTYSPPSGNITNLPRISITDSYGSLNINREDLFVISLKQYIEFIVRIFLCLGLFVIIFFNKNLKLFIMEKNNFIFYVLLSICTFSLGFVFFILPFFSINYDLTRFYSQIILICAPLIIFGFAYILNLFKRIKLVYILSAILCIIYFLNISSFFIEITDNPETPLRLANYGREYNILYPFNYELNGFSFLIEDNSSLSRINTDARTNSKGNLVFSNKYQKERIKRAILSYQINNGEFIFVSYKNKILNFATISYKSSWISIPFPKEFLNEDKNKIYNNGGSEIFK